MPFPTCRGYCRVVAESDEPLANHSRLARRTSHEHDEFEYQQPPREAGSTCALQSRTSIIAIQ